MNDVLFIISIIAASSALISMVVKIANYLYAGKKKNTTIIIHDKDGRRRTINLKATDDAKTLIKNTEALLEEA